jgi:ribosome-associated toxin RatA of RatAB toxin-antitoxin module
VILLLAGLARAESLETLLARGEVALLETKSDGRLRQVVAIGLVRAPPDAVWAKLTNVADYENWVPQVADSTVVEQTETRLVADIAIAVVGPNVNFREEFVLDPANRTIKGTWISGALKGSHWEWRLVPTGAHTTVYRTLYTNVVDSNWLVKQVEDENHTLEYGINVATGMVEIRGLKKALGVP